MNPKNSLEILIDTGGKLIAALLTLFALYKAAVEYFKTRVEIAKEKSTGAAAIKTLEDATRRMQEEIDKLKSNAGNHEKDVEKLQQDFNDLMMRLIDFHFKT